VALKGRGPQQVRQENRLVEKDPTSVETIEKVDNTGDIGHDEGGVNKATPHKRQMVWSQQMEGPSDEPAVRQWSAVNEKDVGMEEDTCEGGKGRGEGMIQGEMEVGVDKGDVEVAGTSVAKIASNGGG
jgi:hypothetical protein